MSKKKQLEREIADMESEIVALEAKSMRSLLALLKDVIDGERNHLDDEQYFRAFITLIEERRGEMKRLQAELDELNGKSKVSES